MDMPDTRHTGAGAPVSPSVPKDPVLNVTCDPGFGTLIQVLSAAPPESELRRHGIDSRWRASRSNKANPIRPVGIHAGRPWRPLHPMAKKFRGTPGNGQQAIWRIVGLTAGFSW